MYVSKRKCIVFLTGSMESFKFTDQTTAGTPSMSILPSITSDKAALRMNDQLYSWYMQALPMVSDPSTKKIYDTVIGVVNRNRRTHQKTKELSADIVKRVEALYMGLPKHEPDAEGAPSKVDGNKDEQKLFKQIQNTLGMSPLPTNVKYNALGGRNKFEEFIKNWKEAKDPSAKAKDPMADNQIEERKNAVRVQLENDPVVSPDNAKITSTDRVIFIAMTFVLRAITIFLVEWAVNTYMVKSFEDAFKLYLVCYLALFAVWAIMVNASNSLFFRMMFYYIDTDSHGMGRILLHFLVQLILLPVPYIVRTKGYEFTDEEYTYEKRRKTMSVLSNFTFFIWAITSIIALRF